MGSRSVGDCTQHSLQPGTAPRQPHCFFRQACLFPPPQPPPHSTQKYPDCSCFPRGILPASLLTLRVGVSLELSFIRARSACTHWLATCFRHNINSSGKTAERKQIIILTVPYYSIISRSKRKLFPKLQWKVLHIHLCTCVELSLCKFYILRHIVELSSECVYRFIFLSEVYKCDCICSPPSTKYRYCI